MKTVEEYAEMIEGSPDRERIERCLEIAFGERDVRKIGSGNLYVFMQRCLPKLVPSVKGGGKGKGKY